MILGSLFSGIGGFDLAAERAGIKTMWQVEINRNARIVLERHFPGAFRHADVCTVGENNLETVDIICGGFPCQDLSVAGKRAGLDGERSGLWFEFARVIDELEPGWVIIENVPGLLSSNRGRDFDVIVQWLAERGYGVAWRVLDAQYFGVPQRRRRVFIVASFGNGRAAEVLFERESGSGDTPKGRKTGEGITGSVTSKFAKGGGPAGDEAYNLIWEMSHANEAVRESGDVIPTLQARMGTGGNQVPMVGVRRLTPLECERLQGFPDGWTAGQSDSERYRQIGNAVAVPVVEWIMRRIVQL